MLSQREIYFPFFFFGPDFFGTDLAADFVAAFFPFLLKAPGNCVSIMFFTSSRESLARSSALYFDSSVFLGSLMIFFPNFMIGPHLAFSIEIFSAGHLCIKRFASFLIFA